MSWYAVDELGPSLEETKGFLLPFDLGLWTKMAVVVLFAGGSTSSLNSVGSATQNTEGLAGIGSTPVEGIEDIPIEDVVTNEVFLTAVALVTVVFLLFSYLSAVFTFVLYDSVHTGDVALRSAFAEYAGDGAKYFAFNLAVLVVWVSSIAALVAAFFTDLYPVLILVPALVPLWILLWLVGFYVRNVTLPEMVVRDTGFVDGLRRTYGYVRGDWKQALLVLVAKIVLGIAAGVVLGIAVAVAIVVLIIPLGIVGGIAYLVSPWLVAIPAVAGVIGLIAAVFAAAVPVETYLYTWVLNVYEGFAGEPVGSASG